VTLFKSVLSRLGLSQTEAAEFLNVRIDTLKKWSAGTNPAPKGVWDQLFELSKAQENEATKAIKTKAMLTGQIKFDGSHAVAARVWERTGVVVTIT